MSSDTQHEAAIEAAAKELYESMFSAADNKTWASVDECVCVSMRDEVRRSVAAYDAARSGEAEGKALTHDEARKRMLHAISGARQGRVTGNGSQGDLFGDDADTEARLRNGVLVIALTDFNDALDRAFPEPRQDQPVTTPSDIERNTYTADRALGLHTARLAEQDQPVDRASGEESEFDFELPTDWETHGMEELDLYARHLDIDVDAIIERTGGLTKPHLVAAIRRQFEPPVEHPETGEREGMLSEADSMKAVIGTVTPRDRDVWQAGRIYEQCLAAEPLQETEEAQ